MVDHIYVTHLQRSYFLYKLKKGNIQSLQYAKIVFIRKAMLWSLDLHEDKHPYNLENNSNIYIALLSSKYAQL